MLSTAKLAVTTHAADRCIPKVSIQCSFSSSNYQQLYRFLGHPYIWAAMLAQAHNKLAKATTISFASLQYTTQQNEY